MIPLYKPTIYKDTIKNVNDCLKTSWISSKGKFINKFEMAFSKFTKIKHSVSVCNGTVAIHLALLALGIKKGDQVIVPSFTYIASVNPIKYINAKPVFVESNLDDFQIDLEDMEKKINKKTKAIICPHLYGNMTDMNKLKNICNKYKIFLIEDCAEAIGSYYKNKHAGNFGSIATFSFYGNKTISTGEGGMVCTNNKTLAKKIFKLKTQGLKNSNKYYFHDIVGYNYRMTNICAAIGFSQIHRLKNILNKKKKLFLDYKSGFKNNKYLSFLNESRNVRSSFWLIVMLVKNSIVREKLIKFLRLNNIETRPTFFPIHEMPMYKIKKKMKKAHILGNNGICLPSYHDLSKKDQTYIIKKIKLFFNEK